MDLIKIEEKNIIFKYNDKNKEFNGNLNVTNISNKIILTKLFVNNLKNIIADITIQCIKPNESKSFNIIKQLDEVCEKEIKILLISLIIEKEINDYKEANKEFKKQDYKNIGQKNKIIGIFPKFNNDNKINEEKNNNLNTQTETEKNSEKEINKINNNNKVNEEKNITKMNNLNYYFIFISICIFLFSIIFGKTLFNK
jgi:hypothetical protein